MKPEDSQSILEQNLRELAEARVHLDYSFHQVEALRADQSPTESQLDSMEAFTSRFSRSVDLLTNKVLRALDRVEMQHSGTLLDVVNRAEKRGFVESADQLREMKDVRNIIAHDYAGKRLPEIHAFCVQQKPIFDAICDRVIVHCQQLVLKT